MTSLVWTLAAALAILWPGRLAGPLDGVPLDQPLEAVVLGLLAGAVTMFFPGATRSRLVRAATVGLLLWKGLTGAALAQDGWCLRFVSPVDLYRATGRVPHSWDLRADWREPTPRCSAVMDHGYTELERFPAWFYNLPPVFEGAQALPSDRPPNVELRFNLDGYLQAREDGVFVLDQGEHVQTRTEIDGIDVSGEASGVGVRLPAGVYHVAISGTLVKSHWSLEPRWNGGSVWRSAVATMTPPADVDLLARPWGRAVPPAAIAIVAVGLLMTLARRLGVGVLGAGLLAATAAAALGASGSVGVRRLAPLLLMITAVCPWPRRARTSLGMVILVAVPFLALWAAIGWPQVGLFTWYSSGDDWWMFQRFGYRIYMEGYWLEAGERTFWFQPLYRWIAGGLHLVFGDSSVGELYWDTLCVAAGSLFSFRLTRRCAGFRWGMLAAVATLVLFTTGPAWYLMGRGLAEISSMGFLSMAALLALKGRRGSAWPLAGAALCVALAFYARLNNLPMALAVAAFAWPVGQSAGTVLVSTTWRRRLSRPVVAAVLGAGAIALWLLAARTWYFTGVPSPFYGTQASHLSVWPAAGGIVEGLSRVTGSLLMVLTMSDPPRFDPRALPVIVGTLAAVLGLMRIGRFSRLPLGGVVFCLAGLVGAVVARGAAYPGRFSVHLIPIGAGLTCCVVSLWLRPDPPSRGLPLDALSQGTMSGPGNRSPRPG